MVVRIATLVGHDLGPLVAAWARPLDEHLEGVDQDNLYSLYVLMFVGKQRDKNGFISRTYSYKKTFNAVSPNERIMALETEISPESD